jgi:hypothetical protein
MGQELVFETAAEAMEKLTLVKVNAKQIERVCHHYGQKIEEQIWNTNVPKPNKVLPAKISPSPYYVMVDGGMVLTREEKWKEMKLCRIFQDSDQIQINKGRTYISHSQYVSHLGEHRPFLAKVESITDYLSQKIFVADGAKWIWNWVEETYPESVQILDFYHAKEHLCGFANIFFKDEEEKQKWVDTQSLWLLNDGILKVLDTLHSLNITDKNKAKARDNLESYYERNQTRMTYKTFREKGWLIGSGAMEAAHRHVIQERMKLSGQRWTIPGAQQVANLRTLRKSNQWDILLAMLKIAV